MPARSKRKGNPDVDKDGYPGPIGRGKGKGKGKGKAKSKAEESDALYYQRRALDEAEKALAEAKKHGDGDDIEDAEHNLKIEKKALAEELAAEKIRAKQKPENAYLLEN